jgi:hypothetical protein
VVWSSARATAENAVAEVGIALGRALFTSTKGRMGRAGRSLGSAVKRCLTWGWIALPRERKRAGRREGPTPCSLRGSGPKGCGSLRGRGRCGESCGLGSRAIGVGCSCRECRLQKSVRGILPAMPRWAARRIKAGQGRAVRRLLPRHRKGMLAGGREGCWRARTRT